MSDNTWLNKHIIYILHSSYERVNSCNGAMPWWQHNKYCHGIIIIIIIQCMQLYSRLQAKMCITSRAMFCSVALKVISAKWQMQHNDRCISWQQKLHVQKQDIIGLRIKKVDLTTFKIKQCVRGNHKSMCRCSDTTTKILEKNKNSSQGQRSGSNMSTFIALIQPVKLHQNMKKSQTQEIPK